MNFKKYLRTYKVHKKIRRMESFFGKQPIISGGPFKGMKFYFPDDRDSIIKQLINSAIIAKLVGTFEEPIHDWISQVVGRQYKRIINVGSAEGYYAI
jgi:hypothetical protein